MLERLEERLTSEQSDAQSYERRSEGKHKSDHAEDREIELRFMKFGSEKATYISRSSFCRPYTVVILVTIGEPDSYWLIEEDDGSVIVPPIKVNEISAIFLFSQEINGDSSSRVRISDRLAVLLGFARS